VELTARLLRTTFAWHGFVGELMLAVTLATRMVPRWSRHTDPLGGLRNGSAVGLGG
jgi:hypothetical protein